MSKNPLRSLLGKMESCFFEIRCSKDSRGGRKDVRKKSPHNAVDCGEDPTFVLGAFIILTRIFRTPSCLAKLFLS